jgi:signal transduction histidine kinase
MSGESVLVADDHVQVRSFLAEYLRSLGHRVQTAADGEQAATLIRTHAEGFALVISDLQMPRLDGLGVLQVTKALAPDTEVIILTGHPTLESAIGALREGAYDYLLKPVENLDELRAVVERALKHRHLVLENRRLTEELRALNADLESRVEQQTHQLREAYAQLQSLDEMKAQFVSVTSHELRTPLAQLFLATDLLADRIRHHSLTDAEMYLGAITAQSQRLRRLIDSLSDFSLMERGEFELERGECHLAALARATADVWRERIEQKQMRLDLSMPEHDIVIYADVSRLQNALDQLLDNAYKFTTEGGRILVGLHGPTRAPWDGAGQSMYAVMAVADSGVGIPAEKQPAIFQAFTQADMSDRRRFGGLGIGLAIAAHIVNAHGGRITLKSEPGQGSVFAMWLPMRVNMSPLVKPG